MRLDSKRMLMRLVVLAACSMNLLSARVLGQRVSPPVSNSPGQYIVEFKGNKLPDDLRIALRHLAEQSSTGCRK